MPGSFFNKVAGLTKETLAQVFSCEFCEIFKSSLFYKTPSVANLNSVRYYSLVTFEHYNSYCYWLHYIIVSNHIWHNLSPMLNLNSFLNFRLNIFAKFSSSHSQMFFKKGVIKNFEIWTVKHLSWSLLLIKLQVCNFIKKRLKRFSVNIAKFLRMAFFFKEHLRWLLWKLNQYKMSMSLINIHAHQIVNKSTLGQNSSFW